MATTTTLHIKVNPLAEDDSSNALADAGISGVQLVIEAIDGEQQSWVYLPNAHLEFLYEWLAGIYLDDIDSAISASHTHTADNEDS